MLKATPSITKSRSSTSTVVRTPEEEAKYKQRCEDMRIAAFEKQCKAFLELTCNFNLVKINAIIKEAAAEHFGSQAEADRLFAADKWGLYTEIDRQGFTPRSIHNFEPDWLFGSYIDVDDDEDGEWTVEKRREMDWPEQMQMTKPEDDQDEHLEQEQKRLFWKTRLMDDIVGGMITEFSLREMVQGAADRADEQTHPLGQNATMKRMDCFRLIQNKVMKQHLTKIETAAIDIAATRAMKHLCRYPESNLIFQRKTFTGAHDVLAEYK